MGGKGSVRYWHKKGLLSKDMLHLSQSGYRVQGKLFIQAFQKSLNYGNANELVE